MTPQKTSILVVDDEPELLEIFALWLARTAYNVLTAPNGAEALNILATTQIDVLITDIRMPIMDGPTLVRRVHEMQFLIPSILFVSGLTNVDYRELYALGAEAMLPKPLDRGDLIAAIEASLKDRQQLWLTPTQDPIAATLALTLSSLNEAAEKKQFAIGRGGFCVLTNQPAKPGTVLELAIQFERDRFGLNGQARVRWYDPEEQRAGLELLYLEAASRRWVIDAMRGKARFSYIPGC